MHDIPQRRNFKMLFFMSAQKLAIGVGIIPTAGLRKSQTNQKALFFFVLK